MRLTSSPSSQGRHLVQPVSRAWSCAIVAAGLLLVFELDRLTVSAPVQHLYYLPIIFAGLSFRMSGSVAADAALYAAKAAGRNQVVVGAIAARR